MKIVIFVCTFLLITFNSLFSQPIWLVTSQKSGPVLVNSYLVVDLQSKEALIIDPGSNIDSLIQVINSNSYVLKYVFMTHAHQDHIVGLNNLRNRFKKLKVGYTKREYQDIKHYMNWKNIFPKSYTDEWQKDSNMLDLMNFNYKTTNKPDCFMHDNQLFKLGGRDIRVISTPGHSRGSITIAIDNNIFPGDLILYNTIGDLEYFLCSEKDIIQSINRLYKEFSDETIIYSGHGKSSTIGFEKRSNKKVRFN